MGVISDSQTIGGWQTSGFVLHWFVVVLKFSVLGTVWENGQVTWPRAAILCTHINTFFYVLSRVLVLKKVLLTKYNESYLNIAAMKFNPFFPILISPLLCCSQWYFLHWLIITVPLPSCSSAVQHLSIWNRKCSFICTCSPLRNTHEF